MNSKPTTTNIYTILEFFNLYSDFFTALASIAALVALIISIIAIYKSSKDNRNLVIAGKLEEIYEIVLNLSVQYGKIYKVYRTLENANNHIYTAGVREATFVSFNHERLKLKQEIDLDGLYTKNLRLNVLANAYLVKSLKFDVIGYYQLFECLINVVNHRTLDNKKDKYPEPLPTPKKVFEVLNTITTAIVKDINFGTDTNGYDNYRETVFKQKLGLRE